MERVIKIVDYYQRLNNNQTIGAKDVDINSYICPIPWTRLLVNQHGECYMCHSPAWLPKSIGSVTEVTTLNELLNSAEAQSIRTEILDNRYTYCNHKLCPHLQTIILSENVTDVVAHTTMLPGAIVETLPEEIVFDFDYTCNYCCPSCRSEPVNHNKGNMYIVNLEIVNKIKSLIIDRYILEKTPVTLRWAGGEPFYSKAYLELWNYISDHCDPALVKLVIQTNGSSIIQQQHTFNKIKPFIKEIRVSFDAGTPETYDIIRKRNFWNRLLLNCRYLVDQCQGTDIVLQSDFVVQLDNYKDIPQYYTVAKDLGFHKIVVGRMWSWGTWEPEIFVNKNVSDPVHPQHNELMNILKSTPGVEYYFD